MSRIAAEPSAAASHDWLRSAWLPALLAAACYAITLAGDFTYDDHAIVRENPRIRHALDFRAIWLTDWWHEPVDIDPIRDPARDRLYRPLALQTFALNFALHGLHPFGYHLVNVLLHALASVLVARLAARWFRDADVAAIAGVLFALHPIHAEAVAGIVGRAELLAAVFLLAGLLALAPERGAPSIRRVALATLAFAAALFSKETAICYPALALLALWFSARDERRGAAWWLVRAGVLLVPLLLYFPLRVSALEGQLIRSQITGVLFNPLYDAGVAARIHGPLTVFGHYVRLMLVPSSLSCDYGLAIIDPAAGIVPITLLGAAAAGGLVFAAAGVATPRRRDAGFLALLLLASYALISNTVLLIGVSLAERLFYWPSVPAIMLIALLGVRGWRMQAREGGSLAGVAPLLRSAGVVLLVALGLRSAARGYDWRDDLALFTADVADHPRGAHLNVSLARILLREALAAPDPSAHAEQLERADGLLARALGINSRYPSALQARGMVALLRGRTADAIRFFSLAVQLNPADRLSQQRLAALTGPGDAAAEIERLERDVADDRADSATRVALVEKLLSVGRNADALRRAEEARRLAPADADVLRCCAEALLVNLRRDEAIALLREALRLREDDWRIHANLATLLKDDDAVATLAHARRAAELRPDDARVKLILAEARLLNGDRAGAIAAFEQILRELSEADPLRTTVQERLRELRVGP